MILTSIKEFRIQHDVTSDVLRVEWVGGHKMNRFRSACEQLCKLAGQLLATRILVEIESLPDIPVYDQLWLSTYFMPGVLRLPLEQVVIILSNKRAYNQHVVEGLLMAVRPLIRFDVQFFVVGDSAMHWLAGNTPRLPALLAEWQRASELPAARPDGVAESRANYLLL
ncbi:hypothetical protein GO988_07310 [Hymenobacter sp. HMF4947]|uniref:STAS/SEC14 domain-containing protein n=1 Tax=Hymenobacter ginkgonis TaxID=2682976 RepID=A0A7K1TCK1_9BACT|nr:hypothetical protein [Hymenobacter ginkgonis]MVN76129.1 hypothetical protein [Hymenobacter ginkgonis]